MTQNALSTMTDGVPPRPPQYMLVLLNFKTPGFAPGHPGDDPLLLEPVTIASLNAPGVTPRSSHAVPPGYARPGEGDYNTTIGYLENGNQRCVAPLRSSLPTSTACFCGAVGGPVRARRGHRHCHGRRAGGEWPGDGSGADAN